MITSNGEYTTSKQYNKIVSRTNWYIHFVKVRKSSHICC